MKHPSIGIATIALAACASLSGCASDQGRSSAQEGATNEHIAQSQASGKCSDADPDPARLTFAAVICVTGHTQTPQPDGSSELKVQIVVTDKDPNAFTFNLIDVKIVDAAGNATEVDFDSASKTGASDCVVQEYSLDSGWSLHPGESFAPPGPICFNLAAGAQPTQFVWEDDVAAPLT